MSEPGSQDKFIVEGSSPLRGTISIPGDKSISHRSLMLGAIAQGKTTIRGLLEGEDCLHTAQVLQQLGVNIQRQGEAGQAQWIVEGVGKQGLQSCSEPLDLGNSGTGMRLLAGLLAGQGIAATLTGDASLMSRPMQRIVTPLTAMGAAIESNNGKPPLKIKSGAKLNAVDYHSKVASAQVKSAILLAALGADGKTRVSEPVKSRDHTERLLPAFGCPVNNDNLSASLQGPCRLQATDIDVPGDISSAAFFIVAASLIEGSDLTILNVGINPTRIGIIQVLEAMGADIEVLHEKELQGEPRADLRVRAAPLRGLEIPPEWVPGAIDEFPAIFVAAAFAQGKTTVRGAEELRVKESDRLGAMASGLMKLGCKVVVHEDGLEIEGGSLHSGEVDSFDDHRIAMAFAVAGATSGQHLQINDVKNVATSFPGFDELARNAGMKISVQHGGSIAKHSDRNAQNIPVLTIDGPSGAGKGTVAQLVANRLGWHLLDSGALYRVAGFAAFERGVAFDDAHGLADMVAGLHIEFRADAGGQEQILLDGQDIAFRIRTEHCGNLASKVAAVPAVRTALVGLQQGFRRPPGLVADGRDMGTVIFPDAPLKVFLTASAEERAQRRHKQLKQKGIDGSLSALLADISKRDERDANREVAPLRPADDAIMLDTTSMGIDEVVAAVLKEVEEQGLRL